MKINSPYMLYYRNKLQKNNRIITTEEYINYILSKFHCCSHHIFKIRKYIAFTLKGFLDCLLLTNQIDVVEHRQHIDKIELYVNYTGKRKEEDY